MAQAFRKQAEANKAIDRANQFRVDIGAIKGDPSPQKLSELYLKYPEYGDDLDRVSKNMAAADRRTYGSILQKAIVAKQRGAPAEEIAAIYAEGSNAALNSGRNDVAERFNAAAEFAKNPSLDDDFAARSLLNQFDPEGYKVIYEQQKEPFIVSNGVAFLRAPLVRLGKDVERLMGGTMTAEQFNGIYGPGKAEGYIKTGTIDVAPSYHAPTQSDIDNLKSGKISPDVFNRVFGPNSSSQYVGGQTGAPATPSGNFP